MKSPKKYVKLTRKILRNQQDWYEWEIAERKQLTQYEEQGIFSEPFPIHKIQMRYLLCGPMY